MANLLPNFVTKISYFVHFFISGTRKPKISKICKLGFSVLGEGEARNKKSQIAENDDLWLSSTRYQKSAQNN